MNSKGLGLTVSHREGRKSCASGPQVVLARCSVAKLVSNRVPAGAKMGVVALGPPPVGRTVSRRAMRLFWGKTGYRRRAGECVNDGIALVELVHTYFR